jgi:Ca2+-transporting ATPase
MRRPPRDAKAPLFAGLTLWLALAQGLGVLLVLLAGTAWSATRLDEDQVRAFAFTTLVLGNLGLMFGNRTQRASLLAALRTRNPALWIVSAAASAFLLLAVYQPWLAALFRFEALPLSELVLAATLGLAGGLAVQGLKAWNSGVDQKLPPAASR